MLSFRKILCPTDFSDPSFRPLATADELARRYQAELHVLHVVLPVPLVGLPPGAGSVAFDVSNTRPTCSKAFRARLDETLAQFVKPDIPIHRYVEIGDPAHEMVQLADKIKPDVIVIATHGPHGT
ncbi:MAG: universal stress protein [bacterium]|nr:universal stress protein [bacterium]